MAIELKTGRGIYTILSAAPLESDADWLIPTLVMERADGVERVGFRCRIARSLLGTTYNGDVDDLIARLRPWVEREFEPTREAALKSIRTERRLLEMAFDSEHRGPF
jgi:hypothetical protein